MITWSALPAHGSKPALFHSTAAKATEHLSPHEPACSEQQHPVGINSVITRRRPEKRMVNSAFVGYSTAVKMNIPIADSNTEGSRTEEQAVHINFLWLTLVAGGLHKALLL